MTSSARLWLNRSVRQARFLSTFLAIALAACVVAGAASAAPRARTTPPNVWATKVCTSLKTWQHTLQKRSTAMTNAKPTNLASLHDAFAGFLAAVVKDTDTLIAQTKAAGTPSVPQGANVAHALVAGFTKLRTYFAGDAQKAKRLSRTNAQKFATGAAALAKQIDAQASSVGRTFDALDKRYHSAALDKAMHGAKACSGIG